MTQQRDQLVTGALAVALLAVFVGLVFVPQQRKLESLRAQAAVLRDGTMLGAAQLARLEGLQAQVRQAESDLAPYDRNIPHGPGLGDFLEQVDVLAARQKVVDPDVVPSASLGGPGIEVLPIEMGFSGTFASVYGFLPAVESLPRLARVSRLEIERADYAGDVLEANVTVRVFYQNGGSEQGIGS